MAVKSVVDTLANLPESELVEMRDAYKAQAAKLRFETEQVEQALEKQAKKRGSRSSQPSGRSRTPSSNGSTGMTRRKVYALVREIGQPVTPAEARKILAARGIEVEAQSLRIHMQRLVNRDHLLIRDDDGRYEARPESQAPLTDGEEADEAEN